MRELVLIESGQDFWALVQEMEDDKERFADYKDFLVEAFKEETIYGLMDFQESDFCKGAFTQYLLPCLCIVHEKECIFVWTHTRSRKKGLGTALVRMLKIEKVSPMLPTAKGFWTKLGF